MVEKKQIIIKLIAIQLVLFGYGQAQKNALDSKELKRCLTMDMLEERISNDSSYRSFYKKAYQIPKVDSQLQKREAKNAVVVPVAFHFANNVLGCEDIDCLLGTVQDQLDVLNEAFADNTVTSLEANCPSAYQDNNGNSVASTGTDISFCYATPPQGNAQGLDPACDPPITIGAFNGGLNGGGNGAPGWNGILNIFITPNNCLGVADGIPGDANGDGVTICASAFGGKNPSLGCGLDTEFGYDQGKTLTHEIGHYLGLFHTFEGGCSDEPSSGGPYNVDDTPAIFYETSGCNTTCVDGGCGLYAATANFMDYSDDACMSMFSKDQALVMNYWANQLFGNAAVHCGGSNPTKLTSLCDNAPCISICPTTVVAAISIKNDFCGTTGSLNFPDPISNGLSLNTDSNDQKFVWSVNGYISANGTVVANPITTSASLCSVSSRTYYLNVDCYSTPLANLLQGGTYTVTVYPDRPADLNSLVNITSQNTCNEPIITPVAGCQNYVDITANSSNVSFPVNAGESGVVTYTLNYTPNFAGPDCCLFTDTEGELILNGDFEMGTANWLETEEVPFGYNPFGIIGVSGNNSFNGTTDAWFGGWGQNSYSKIEQNIVIPDCNNINLSFNFATFQCSSLNSTILNISIGNTIVATVNCESSGIYVFGPINIKTANLPIGNQVLKIEAVETGNGGSILVDNVSLISSGCSIPIDCNEEISLNYSCSSNCITSLNFINPHNMLNTYQAAVSIQSIATVNANINYKAGTRVSLRSGFSTRLPNNFSAYIENCN